MESNWIMGLFTGEFVFALFAAELRNLRWAIVALALQSLILVAIICTFGYLTGMNYLYWWASVAFVLRVLLIPWLLWKYSGKFPVAEVKPRIGLIPSVIAMAIILPTSYHYIHTGLSAYLLALLPPSYVSISGATGLNLALGLTILVLGIYVLLIRRDIIKIVIGLVLMENGVQWALVSRVLNIQEVALEVGIACNLVIVSWILLFFSTKIYELWGTKDTDFLSELRW